MPSLDTMEASKVKHVLVFGPPKSGKTELVGNWPMASQGCVAYGRPCEYMDMCQLPTESLGAKLKENQLVERDRKTGEVAEYDFELTLKELLL